jgi:hypothetical protein
MSALAATIAGIGFWHDGLPDWAAACEFARSGALVPEPPAKPAPQLLAPNERRRAPPSVLVALEVALAACRDAGASPDALPSVFASTHGDLGITDYMCETLARAPTDISPTRFHNSVHNAAAGYWTIGAGCMHTATAISAHRASFAQGLLEALVQLDTDADAVLLVGYDTAAGGLLSTVTRSEGLLGAALVLARSGPGPRLAATLQPGEAGPGDGPLGQRAHANAMAPMLPLFDALVARAPGAVLTAGPGHRLVLELSHD